MSLISTNTPLLANATYSSGSFQIARATYLTGMVIADQNGTLTIQQSNDGINWDVSTPLNVQANNGIGFQETVVGTFFQILYTNGNVNQASFRLSADARDQYGTFLLSQAQPSPGGAFVVLYFDPIKNDYITVGRFDGPDNFNVNEQAAVFTGKTGKYASALASQFVATQETLGTTSNSTPATF